MTGNNQVWITIRRLLKPWWGKLVALVGVVFLVLTWFVVGLYSGYQNEQAWFRANFQIRSAGVHFLLPKWMKHVPIIYEWSARCSHLNIQENFGTQLISEHTWVEISKMKNIRKFWIGNVYVNDEQLKSYIATMPNLTHLRIVYCDLTDASLETLRSMTQLKELKIWSPTKLSMEGRIELDAIMKKIDPTHVSEWE